MMAVSDIRDLVSSLFIMLNKDKFILFRIEFLVVFATSLFLAMFIMDIFRRYNHSSITKAIFSLCDAVSDSIVIYLLGLMKTAPFKNQLFPVWGLVLVVFRHNIDFISGYGVPDRGGRSYTEYKNVIRLLGSALLNRQADGSKFKFPLWTLWALQSVRSWYRFQSRTWASKSYWHGKSSELVSEHMRVYPSKLEPKEYNTETMKGYRYLIYGEKVEIEKPRYALNIIDPTTKNSLLVTLDKIWTCQGHLLNPDRDQNRSEDGKQVKDLKNKNDQKDLSMAFALSRLLRCRLEDVMLPKDMYIKNRELVKSQIIEEQDAKRAFRILELQLAYVNDYFNTRYPMVFWSGLLSLCLSLLQSVVTIGVVLWLSVEIRKVYKPPDGELAHLVNGVNVDMIITWVFMFFMMFKEIWEMVAYLLSDWTRLLLVCMYAKWEAGHFMEKITLWFFASKITSKQWHGLLDQYVFVQSYDYKPRVWNWFHTVTTGLVPKEEEGAKLGGAIDVPDCVRCNILKKLPEILEKAISEKPTANANGNSDEHTYGLHLPNEIMILSRKRNEEYRRAYSDMQTSSQVILVWHIATSLCEMELAKKRGHDLSNPGFLRSIWSCFTSCCSSKHYLISVDDEKDEAEVNASHSGNSGFTCSLLSNFRNCFTSKSAETNLSRDLKERYIVANSLSRYCAYLLVSKPDFIPDSFLVPQMVFKKTVKSACDDILRHCDSLESRYTKLSLEAYKAEKDRTNEVEEGEEILKQGAMLGKALLTNEGEEGCWEILADVWTELIIHIAPTWNAEAHKKCLESGGEFITIIWALLWHCGIEKSKLWPEDDPTEKTSPPDLSQIVPEDGAPSQLTTETQGEENGQEIEDGSVQLH